MKLTCKKVVQYSRYMTTQGSRYYYAWKNGVLYTLDEGATEWRRYGAYPEHVWNILAKEKTRCSKRDVPQEVPRELLSL